MWPAVWIKYLVLLLLSLLVLSGVCFIILCFAVVLLFVYSFVYSCWQCDWPLGCSVSVEINKELNDSYYYCCCYYYYYYYYFTILTTNTFILCILCFFYKDVKLKRWRKLYNEDFYNLYCLSNAVRLNKPRKMSWAGYVVWKRKINA